MYHNETVGVTMGFLKKFFGSDEEMPEEASKLFEEGKEQFRRKEMSDAIDTLKKGLRIYPKYAEAEYVLGKIYLSLKEDDEAKKHFLAATEIDKQYYLAFYELGNIYMREKNVKKAIEAYKREIEIEPNPERTVAVAREIRRLERDNAAADFLKKSLQSVNKIKRQFQPTMTAMAYYELGELLLEMAKYDDAFEQLNKAVQMYPRHANAHHKLSQILARMGESEKSIEHMKEAARLGNRECQSKLLKWKIGWKD